MRKILLTTSAMIPMVAFATALLAQSPLPPQGGQQASPAAGEPASGKAAGQLQQPTTGADAKGAPDPMSPTAEQQRAPNPDQKAQGHQTTKRQQTEAMQKEGTAGSAGSAKQAQDGKGVRPEPTAQRKPDEPSNTAPPAQRSSTNAGESAQPREGRAATESVDSVNITAEKRTTIRQSITSERITPIRDVNFSVSVGVEVPRTIELRPLPARVVEIVPQYRGYRFFVLADGRIVIVRPQTYEIVYIITA